MYDNNLMRVFCACGAAYLMQYLPTLGLSVMKVVGPGRAASLKEGGSGYDMKAMFLGGQRKAD
jgi:hypothetical protein